MDFLGGGNFHQFIPGLGFCPYFRFGNCSNSSLISQIKVTYIAPKKSHFTNTQKGPNRKNLAHGFGGFFFETSIRTRWAPTSYKWCYNPPYELPYSGGFQKKNIRTDEKIHPWKSVFPLNLLDDGQQLPPPPGIRVQFSALLRETNG